MDHCEDFTMFIKHRPCEFFPSQCLGVVFIIIVITDWQQTVCLFSYYPIQPAIHYKPISKNTVACWDLGWITRPMPEQVGDEIIKTLF